MMRRNVGANPFRHFWRDEQGSVSAISALMLAALIGVAGLVVEYGTGLLAHMEDQRIADLAAFTGGIVYNSTSSTTQATSAISKLVALNGLASSAAAPSITTSPSGDGNTAVLVAVTTTAPLLLSRVLNSASSLSINASSYAELKANAQACIIALASGGTGVTLSGGTALSAPSCAVASNNTVSVPCGTTMTTIAVQYNSSSAPSQPCSGIAAPSGSSLHIIKTATSDPLAGNTEIVNAATRMSTVSGMTAPTITVPTVASALPATIRSATAIAFNWNSLSGTLPTGCTAAWSGSTWRVTCAASSSAYNFGGITVGGGITLAFNVGGSASNTYTFYGNLDLSSGSGFTFGPGTYEMTGNLNTSQTTIFGATNSSAPYTIGTTNFYVQGSMNITGSTTTFGNGNFYVGGSITTSGGDTVTFGNGNFYVTGAVTLNSSTTFGTGTFDVGQGITTGGGTTNVFGAGTFNIGQSTSACSGAGKYSICNTGTSLIFGGPSTFVITNGIDNTGGETLTLGSGTTNSFNIGAASDGNAFNMGGGAKTVFADATGTGDLFQMDGNLNVTSGGGSCLTISAAAEHDINGFVATAGGTTLGAGIYTVNGYVGLGLNGGGDVTCNGSTVGMYGNNVTFVVSGLNAPSAGAFSVAAGYGHVTLVAPATGITAALAVVGPTPTDASTNTSGASFTQGASNTSVSGVFYFPQGPITLSGAGTVTNGNSIGSTGSNQCLEMIGTQISVTQGSLLGTTCISGTASGGTVALVQ
jgi:hypothetical protein